MRDEALWPNEAPAPHRRLRIPLAALLSFDYPSSAAAQSRVGHYRTRETSNKGFQRTDWQRVTRLSNNAEAPTKLSHKIAGIGVYKI